MHNPYLPFIVHCLFAGRKDIRHEPGDAGTTKSFVDAKAYFDGFEGIPYDLVTVSYSHVLLVCLVRKGRWIGACMHRTQQLHQIASHRTGSSLSYPYPFTPCWFVGDWHDAYWRRFVLFCFVRAHTNTHVPILPYIYTNYYKQTPFFQGNHDLEGLDEFDTDEENLRAWMDCFDYKKTPYFSRRIGERTLLVGLSTVRFRDAPYSSHEVHVDDDQIEWFRNVVRSHPDSEGWKILVFSHAPITGSGLRVLQSVHVTNGCAWLNHCSPTDVRNSFVRIVGDNPQIKCWLSGHFHLSHDYQDALVQAVPGSPCAFLQVGVMGPGSSRDQKRQSRMIRGCGGEFLQVFSINHHERVGDGKARVRLDATIDLRLGQLTYEEGDDQSSSSSPSSSNGSGNNSRAEATETAAVTAGKDSDWFQAYVPQPEDGCYLEDVDGTINCMGKTVCWWHMADGKVLGLHEGQLVEYDSETLSPLGVVVTKEKLTIQSKGNGNNTNGGDGSDIDNPPRTKEVLVVQNQSTLVLVDDETRDMEVIHPNADGSYWRKFQRNKKIRLEEKAREEVARRWIAQNIVTK